MQVVDVVLDLEDVIKGLAQCTVRGDFAVDEPFLLVHGVPRFGLDQRVPHELALERVVNIEGRPP
jgi:hypothetical protein